jgi:sterol desaturase/sphingolipid hydroxylase (fatty acid hydroxylase superfamily)
MDLFTYIILGCFIAFVIADHLGKRTAFPNIRYWRTMGAISFVLYFAIAIYAPYMWNDFLGAHQLIDGSVLPLWAQVVIGFLIIEFGIYFWHRTMHNVDLIWRFTHQMHHAAERPDIWGAYYFHPVDMLGWALLGSLCLVWVFGLGPEASMIVGIISTIPGMFQHMNVRTPYWIGYILQRPESHLIHHERGVHAYNYGDIPLPDIIFGTFRNPRSWDAQNGFHEGSTWQLRDLLLFRKIS